MATTTTADIPTTTGKQKQKQLDLLKAHQRQHSQLSTNNNTDPNLLYTQTTDLASKPVPYQNHTHNRSIDTQSSRKSKPNRRKSRRRSSLNSLSDSIPQDGTNPDEQQQTSTLQKLAFKLSLKYSSFVNRLKVIADQVLESDEIVEELFDNSSSTSVSDTEPINNKNISMMTQAKIPQTETPIGTTPQIQTPTQNSTSSDPSVDEDQLIYSTTNTSVSNNMMNEPFIGGEELWELQNDDWLTPSPQVNSAQGKLNLVKKLHDQELRHFVSSKDYHIVYKSLVMNNKVLKRPINLKDLMRVVEAGWHYNNVFENAAQSAKENSLASQSAAQTSQQI